MSSTSLSSAIVKESRPRALAALMRSFRDLDMAEDLYQEACLHALEHWRQDSLPRDPTAWLITVARNAGLDRIRKNRRNSSLDAAAALEAKAPDDDVQADTAEAIDRQEFRDDVLRPMFLCCHPELKAHEQLALALKVVVGFSVEEIARAFVITPDTMQRRLSRAKLRAADTATKLATPGLVERAERLAAVQTMIYLMFNEGYGATGGDEQIRHALCGEVIRLARLLLDLFPAQAELMGLLALCLLQHARAPARIDAQDRLVSLDPGPLAVGPDENRRGPHARRKGAASRPSGASSGSGGYRGGSLRGHKAEDTDWAEIERLYGALEMLAPGPIARLNRAVAVAKLNGPVEALALLAPLSRELSRYRPYHSVRAAFLEESGDVAAAIGALEGALACQPTRQEREYPMEKIGALKENRGFLSD